MEGYLEKGIQTLSLSTHVSRGQQKGCPHLRRIPLPSEEGGGGNVFKDFYLNTKARIWPWTVVCVPDLLYMGYLAHQNATAP